MTLLTLLIFLFKKMSVTNHRVYYLNSDMVVNDNHNNKFKKTLKLQSFDEDYTHVSLLHAVIPNSFPTIQEEANEYYEFLFHLGIGENAPHVENQIVSIKIKIPEGFYEERDILDILNENMKQIKYTDFGLSQDVSIFENMTNFLSIDDKTCHIKTTNERMNVMYNMDGKPYYWIKEIDILSRDLGYKVLGIPKNNYFVCFNWIPPNDLGASGIVIKPVQYPHCQLPNRPSLIWVNAISIRMDIVNIIQDSHVLENIPVVDPTAQFITYQNNDILNSSKKFNNTYNNGYIEIQITQQNGYEINLDNIEFSLDIVVFKV